MSSTDIPPAAPAGPAAPAAPAAAPAAAAGRTGPAEAGKRGRPRSEEADHAILRAATDLFAERGLPGMSIEEVAARAGVGKATVYRRWPTKGALALDAFLALYQGQQPEPDTGSLRGDVLAALRGWVGAVTQTAAGQMLAGLIAAVQHDPELAENWRDRVIAPLRARHFVMLDRAIARGEIPPDTDKDVVLDLLFGAGYHRLLLGHQPLEDAFVRRVVETIVAGTIAAGGTPARTSTGE